MLCAYVLPMCSRAAAGILGVAEFMLGYPRRFRGIAAADGTRVLQITQDAWRRCVREQPSAAACLEAALLKLTCLQEVYDPLHYPVIA